MPDTLLLADDSATIQRVIEMTFAEEDVRVVTVRDGREAVDHIAADPPDIVLADTNMPEKDGYAVSAFVKSDRRLSHIPVVLLTGAFDPVDDERAREVGCDAVLVKPFEPNVVLHRVRELLGAPADSPTTAGPDAPGPEPAIGDAAPSLAGSVSAESASAAGPPDVADAAAAPSADASAWSSASADGPAGAETAAASSADAPPSSVPTASAAVPPSADASAPQSVSSASSADTPSSSAEPAAISGESSSADAPAPPAVPAAPPAVPAVEAPAPPTLADAFASLLAAEQGDLERARAAYPWPRLVAPAEDDLVERVAVRVVERLSSDVTGELVSEVVAQVAERLVREQIGRIKSA